MASVEDVCTHLAKALARRGAWAYAVPLHLFVFIEPAYAWEVRLLPGIPFIRFHTGSLPKPPRGSVVVTMTESVLCGLYEGKVPPHLAVDHGLIRVRGDVTKFLNLCHHILRTAGADQDAGATPRDLP